MGEDIKIFDDLVADYIKNASSRFDYAMLLVAIVNRTSNKMSRELAESMLRGHTLVLEKQSELESVSVPSTWLPMGEREVAAPQAPALPRDTTLSWNPPAGREDLPEDLFGADAAQRGAIANFIQDKYGQTSGAFRNFLSNRDQQRSLESRFQLASTADPQGSLGGFSKFMQGLGKDQFRTSGPNIGQADLLARYLSTPDSGAYKIPIPQRDAIEGFRTDQRSQFDLLMNPLIANLSPYSTGGFQRSAQANFDDWMGRNLDNPNAQYLPYIRGRNFVP